MSNMKKIVCILLAAVCGCCLAGCADWRSKPPNQPGMRLAHVDYVDITDASGKRVNEYYLGFRYPYEEFTPPKTELTTGETYNVYVLNHEYVGRGDIALTRERYLEYLESRYYTPDKVLELMAEERAPKYPQKDVAFKFNAIYRNAADAVAEYDETLLSVEQITTTIEEVEYLVGYEVTGLREGTDVKLKLKAESEEQGVYFSHEITFDFTESEESDRISD